MGPAQGETCVCELRIRQKEKRDKHQREIEEEGKEGLKQFVF